MQKHFEKFCKSNLVNKKIAITGSKGFIANHVKQKLKYFGINKSKLVCLNSTNTNYFQLNNLKKKLKGVDYVIHLSSATGGIKYTKEKSSEQFYITMLKDLNIFEASKQCNVKKVITLGNLHAYPGDINGMLKEKDLHKGLPVESHIGIGWSKRNLDVLRKVYSKNNSKTKFLILYSANCYGPGDTLDLNHGHIIPKLIIQCLKNKDFQIFGSTNAVREFIYVKDLTNIIILSLLKLNNSCSLNIGSGESIKISHLIKKIIKKTAFEKKIKNQSFIIDNSKRYCGKVNLEKFLNYKILYKLEEGLKETIDWYKKFV